MSHLSHDDAMLLLGELSSWPDEDFAVILRSAASAADLIRVVLYASHRSTASARPGLLGGDWSGRMTAAAAQEGVGSSGNILHCGGVGSSPGIAACAMARCTRATGTAMAGSVEGDAPHTHEKRGSEDEITTWNVIDDGACGAVFVGARQSVSMLIRVGARIRLPWQCPSRIHAGTGARIRPPWRLSESDSSGPFFPMVP
jgi:hypothetical protein